MFVAIQNIRCMLTHIHTHKKNLCNLKLKSFTCVYGWGVNFMLSFCINILKIFFIFVSIIKVIH